MTSEHKRRHKVTMPRINTLKKTKKYHANKHPKFKSNKWQKFYGNKAWHNLRESKLIKQPLCERCLEHDIIRPATDVHHKCVYGDCPTEEEQWYWFLNQDNLISLCKQCHQHIHNTNERGWIEHWPFLSQLDT